MSDDAVARILEEYDSERDRLEQFRRKVELLVRELLAAKGHRVHSVSSRVKERDSLERKAHSTARKYSALVDVTDLVGIRIITLFDDQVDQVAEAVETEFDIDKRNSVDRRELMDPDRFGYLSLHYVSRLSPERRGLAEYCQYADCVAEIQIRSILQHAWAEIYHDLGYKSREGIPRDFERGFARVASVLELADAEFVRLREGLRKYEADVGGQISASPESVEINQASLLSFIMTSAQVAQGDKRIAQAAQTELKDPSTTLVSTLASGLRYLGLRTISDVEREIRTQGDAPVRLAQEYYRGPAPGPGLPRGISLTFLGDLLALKGKPEERYVEYVREGLGLDGEDSEFLAPEMIDAYRRMKAKEMGASEGEVAAS